MSKKLKDVLKQNEINPEHLSVSDIKKVSKLRQELNDDNLAQEYFKFFAGALPEMLTTLRDFASQHLGKEVIESINKRIETLNKIYETEKDIEILKMIQEEISDLFDRVEREADKQRDWLLKLSYGAIGSAALLGSVAIGVKNKETGKKNSRRRNEANKKGVSILLW
ncbi:hypothetical protein JNUCC1_02641 [Lentibacillus sp. JNUCC-1]|uniref:hypothetical protein n=1 Tax=Lentibacillus sp. JNUCC-1 TaxID=2654513 RepID=UPI0012E8342E|nr:hypothetical protein [Lentibacillus sp. JNUCC-1]MUV38770.1 hypothetical protein [Lentibacillus sp. JNUCC-1]